MKEEYPEGIYQNITIKLNRHSEELYSVFCPEWKCHFHTKTPAKAVQELVSEIMEHNKLEANLSQIRNENTDK